MTSSRSPARARRRRAGREGLRDLRGCLHRWLKLADVEDGVRPGTTTSESAELRELRRRNKVARAGERDPAPGRGVLRQGDLPKMMYPLVHDLAADGIPVAVTCRVLGFTKQAYYAWQARPVSRAGLGRRVSDQRRPGHPRRRSGVRVPVHRRRARRARHHRQPENRVARLCSQQRIWSVFAKTRGPDQEAGPPVHDDLVERDFTAAGAEPGVADRHHRAPHRRGQAVPVRDQGRVLRPDRRLLHRHPDESLPGRRGAVATRSGSGTRPAPWSTPTAAANSGPGHSSKRWRVTAWSARWAGSAPAGTTPRWNRSSPCYKATSWTGNAGPPATNCAWRS